MGIGRIYDKVVLVTRKTALEELVERYNSRDNARFMLTNRGAPFDALAHVDFGTIGLFIVGAFVVTWVAAFAVFKIRRVEERWSALVDGRREMG